MSLITLSNVRKYDVKKPYNVHIDKGSFTLLVGKNGSGKTTLIRLILGFIEPDVGKIVRHVHKIAYLPEVVTLPSFMKGYMFLMCFSNMKKATYDPKLLHLFDVPLFIDVDRLSKGNKQKLAIIATLIGDADLYLLDEPFSGLDEISISRFISYLSILKKDGKTVMIVSHQPALFDDLITNKIIL